MDDKDKQILEILSKEADLSIREVAKKTLIPISTVHNRIRKLKQDKIIKNFTINIDYEKVEKYFSVILLASLDYNVMREQNIDEHKIAKKIKNLPEVESLFIVTGDTDMIIILRVKNVKEFEEFLVHKLRKMLGITSTKTLVITKEF